MEKKEWKAREMLVKLDEDKGVMVSPPCLRVSTEPTAFLVVRNTDEEYHPLHAMRSNPLKTLPPPLIRLIYPADIGSRSPSPEPIHVPGSADPTVEVAERSGRYVSEAERTRERMRRDMLTVIPTDEEDEVLARKKRLGLDGEAIGAKPVEDTKVYGDIDWKEMVSGTKKVLGMDVSWPDRVDGTCKHLEEHSKLIDSTRRISHSSSRNSATSTCSVFGARPNMPRLKKWTVRVDVQVRMRTITEACLRPSLFVSLIMMHYAS
jgi:hypothetical protein